MAENITTNEAAVNRSCDEPVCIDARRVYDSCGDKDCLSDLPVFFTDEGQQLIDSAVNVRLRDADVLNVMLDIEPPCTTPASVTGLCISDKKVILYGSEGNVRIFSSDLSTDEYDTQNSPARSLPTANVQVAQPIPLAATLKEKRPCHRLPRKIPTAIENRIGGSVTDSGEKIVLATLGVFSIVQLLRNVQMLIPAYDFCVPEKRCVGSTDSPCEMFSRLDFPTDEFFPPNVSDCNSGESGGCGCCSDKDD